MAHAMITFELCFMAALFTLCEAVCPSSWTDGQSYGFPGCFKLPNVGSQTVPDGIRTCKSMDSRAQLPYVPEIVDSASVASFRTFAKLFFPYVAEPFLWVSAGAFGNVSIASSYKWYYLAANGSTYPTVTVTGPLSSSRYNGENCLSFISPVLGSLSCSSTVAILCHIRDHAAAATLPRPSVGYASMMNNASTTATRCPITTGWVFISGICYSALPSLVKSDTEARTACKTKYANATLPYFITEDRWKLFYTRLVDYTRFATYQHQPVILQMQKGSTGEYLTNNGSTFYTDWYMNQPDTSQSCVTMTDLDGFMWRTSPCSMTNATFFGVCQISLLNIQVVPNLMTTRTTTIQQTTTAMYIDPGYYDYSTELLLESTTAEITTSSSPSTSTTNFVTSTKRSTSSPLQTTMTTSKATTSTTKSSEAVTSRKTTTIPVTTTKPLTTTKAKDTTTVTRSPTTTVFSSSTKNVSTTRLFTTTVVTQHPKTTTAEATSMPSSTSTSTTLSVKPSTTIKAKDTTTVTKGPTTTVFSSTLSSSAKFVSTSRPITTTVVTQHPKTTTEATSMSSSLSTSTTLLVKSSTTIKAKDTTTIMKGPTTVVVSSTLSSSTKFISTSRPFTTTVVTQHPKTTTVEATSMPSSTSTSTTLSVKPSTTIKAKDTTTVMKGPTTTVFSSTLSLSTKVVSTTTTVVTQHPKTTTMEATSMPSSTWTSTTLLVKPSTTIRAKDTTTIMKGPTTTILLSMLSSSTKFVSTSRPFTTTVVTQHPKTTTTMEATSMPSSTSTSTTLLVKPSTTIKAKDTTTIMKGPTTTILLSMLSSSTKFVSTSRPFTTTVVTQYPKTTTAEATSLPSSTSTSTTLSVKPLTTIKANDTTTVTKGPTTTVFSSMLSSSTKVVSTSKPITTTEVTRHPKTTTAEATSMPSSTWTSTTLSVKPSTTIKAKDTTTITVGSTTTVFSSTLSWSTKVVSTSRPFTTTVMTQHPETTTAEATSMSRSPSTSITMSVKSSSTSGDLFTTVSTSTQKQLSTSSALTTVSHGFTPTITTTSIEARESSALVKSESTYTTRSSSVSLQTSATESTIGSSFETTKLSKALGSTTVIMRTSTGRSSLSAHKSEPMTTSKAVSTPITTMASKHSVSSLATRETVAMTMPGTSMSTGVKESTLKYLLTTVQQSAQSQKSPFVTSTLKHSTTSMSQGTEVTSSTLVPELTTWHRFTQSTSVVASMSTRLEDTTKLTSKSVSTVRESTELSTLTTLRGSSTLAQESAQSTSGQADTSMKSMSTDTKKVTMFTSLVVTLTKLTQSAGSTSGTTAAKLFTASSPTGARETTSKRSSAQAQDSTTHHRSAETVSSPSIASMESMSTDTTKMTMTATLAVLQTELTQGETVAKSSTVSLTAGVGETVKVSTSTIPLGSPTLTQVSTTPHVSKQSASSLSNASVKSMSTDTTKVTMPTTLELTQSVTVAKSSTVTPTAGVGGTVKNLASTIPEGSPTLSQVSTTPHVSKQSASSLSNASVKSMSTDTSKVTMPTTLELTQSVTVAKSSTMTSTVGVGETVKIMTSTIPEGSPILAQVSTTPRVSKQSASSLSNASVKSMSTDTTKVTMPTTLELTQSVTVAKSSTVTPTAGVGETVNILTSTIPEGSQTLTQVSTTPHVSKQSASSLSDASVISMSADITKVTMLTTLVVSQTMVQKLTQSQSGTTAADLVTVARESSEPSTTFWRSSALAQESTGQYKSTQSRFNASSFSSATKVTMASVTNLIQSLSITTAAKSSSIPMITVGQSSTQPPTSTSQNQSSVRESTTLSVLPESSVETLSTDTTKMTTPKVLVVSSTMKTMLSWSYTSAAVSATMSDVESTELSTSEGSTLVAALSTAVPGFTSAEVTTKSNMDVKTSSLPQRTGSFSFSQVASAETTETFTADVTRSVVMSKSITMQATRFSSLEPEMTLQHSSARSTLSQGHALETTMTDVSAETPMLTSMQVSTISAITDVNVALSDTTLLHLVTQESTATVSQADSASVSLNSTVMSILTLAQVGTSLMPLVTSTEKIGMTVAATESVLDLSMFTSTPSPRLDSASTYKPTDYTKLEFSGTANSEIVTWSKTGSAGESLSKPITTIETPSLFNPLIDSFQQEYFSNLPYFTLTARIVTTTPVLSNAAVTIELSTMLTDTPGMEKITTPTVSMVQVSQTAEVPTSTSMTLKKAPVITFAMTPAPMPATVINAKEETDLNGIQALPLVTPSLQRLYRPTPLQMGMPSLDTTARKSNLGNESQSESATHSGFTKNTVSQRKQNLSTLQVETKFTNSGQSISLSKIVTSGLFQQSLKTEKQKVEQTKFIGVQGKQNTNVANKTISIYNSSTTKPSVGQLGIARRAESMVNEDERSYGQGLGNVASSRAQLALVNPSGIVSAVGQRFTGRMSTLGTYRKDGVQNTGTRYEPELKLTQSPVIIDSYAVTKYATGSNQAMKVPSNVTNQQGEKYKAMEYTASSSPSGRIPLVTQDKEIQQLAGVPTTSSSTSDMSQKSVATLDAIPMQSDNLKNLNSSIASTAQQVLRENNAINSLKISTPSSKSNEPDNFSVINNQQIDTNPTLSFKTTSSKIYEMQEKQASVSQTPEGELKNWKVNTSSKVFDDINSLANKGSTPFISLNLNKSDQKLNSFTKSNSNINEFIDKESIETSKKSDDRKTRNDNSSDMSNITDNPGNIPSAKNVNATLNDSNQLSNANSKETYKNNISSEINLNNSDNNNTKNTLPGNLSYQKYPLGLDINTLNDTEYITQKLNQYQNVLANFDKSMVSRTDMAIFDRMMMDPVNFQILPTIEKLKTFLLDEHEDTHNFYMASRVQDVAPFLFNILDSNLMMTLAHQFKDMVVNCQFNGVNCFPEALNVTTMHNPIFNLCYKMTSTGIAEDKQMFGGSQGLTLKLKSEAAEYLESLMTSGFKLVIADEEEMPLPHVDGYDIDIRYLTHISLTKGVQIKSASYSLCNSEVGYSPELCHIQCEQAHLMKVCNCTDPRFSIQPVNTTCMISKKDCIDYTTGGCNEELKSKCSCPPKCKNVMFNPLFTKTKAHFLSRHTCESNKTSKQQCSSDANTAVIHITFSNELTYAYYEVPAYDVSNLLSDLSNILGLALGPDAFIIPEFIIAICITIWNGYSYLNPHSS